MLIVGGIIVFGFIFVGIFAPILAPHDPLKMNMKSRFSPPTLEFLMGTDHIGRDIISRIIFGTRVSFQVGIIAVAIGMIGGIFIGSISGYMGGFIDDILMRMMDGLLSFPPLLLALGLVASVGPGLWTLSICIGFVYMPRFARVMRSAVLVEKEKEYVESAKAIGQSGFNILLRHIGPSTISTVIVLGTIIFALAIIVEAAMSFLGVGLPPPTPSWGMMLNEARRHLHRSIFMPVFPGMAISLAVLGFNLLGDGLRDFLDPREY
jgi:ABC-type dipeptide/oligopeptide/nickel transport system permease subunit